MNWSVLRREWGAVTFVLTVLVGVIVVPVALYLTNQGPAPVAVAVIPTTASPQASGAYLASPTPSATPARTASPSPKASPKSSPKASPKASPTK